MCLWTTQDGKVIQFAECLGHIVAGEVLAVYAWVHTDIYFVLNFLFLGLHIHDTFV